MSKIISAFEMLQRLSKSEKRYISIIVKRTIQSSLKPQQSGDQTSLSELAKEGPSHLRLFGYLSDLLKNDEIPVQEVLDSEEFLKLKEDNQSLFTTVNITRLIDFLLTSLRQYYAEKEDFIINNYIQNIHILQEKQLYEHADEWIDKGLKKLAENERPGSDFKALELLRLKRRNILKHGNKPDYQLLEKISDTCTEHWNRAGIVLGTMRDQEITQQYSRGNGFPPDFTPSRFSATTQSFIASPSVDMSLPLEAMLMGAYSAHIYLKRNPAKFPEDARKSILCTKAMVERLDEENNLREIDPTLYLNTVQSWVNGSIAMGEVSALEENLGYFQEVLGMKADTPLKEEFRKIQFNKQSLEQHYHVLNALLLYLLGKEDLKTAYQLAGHVKDQIENGEPRPSIRLHLYFNLAGIFLLNKDYETASEVNSRIGSFPEVYPDREISSSMILQSQLLEIIINYETIQSDEDRNRVIKKIGPLISEFGAYNKPEGSSDPVGEENLPSEDLLERPMVFLHALFGIVLERDRSRQKQHYLKIVDTFTKNRGPFVPHIFLSWARMKLKELKG